MYGNFYQQLPQMPQYHSRQEVTRVNGRAGADMFALAPNSSALLLDETAPIVWLKTTDGAGYPTVTGYNISPMQTKEQKDNSRFDLIEKRLNELEGRVNAKSDDGHTQSEQTVKHDTAD